MLLLLQSTVSDDPSEIILICRLFPADNTRNSYAVMIIWCLENSKEQHLFKTEIFCNIKNVFTVTFDPFNASIKKEEKNIVDSKLLNGSKYM